MPELPKDRLENNPGLYFQEFIKWIMAIRIQRRQGSRNTQFLVKNLFEMKMEI